MALTDPVPPGAARAGATALWHAGPLPGLGRSPDRPPRAIITSSARCLTCPASASTSPAPGPKRARCGAGSKACVQDRVHFLGRRSQAELRRLYSAADALVLASSREGWANVLLEAMACRAPVVASNVWGTPEVVAAPRSRCADARAERRRCCPRVTRLRAAMPDRARHATLRGTV